MHRMSVLHEDVPWGRTWGHDIVRGAHHQGTRAAPGPAAMASR